MDLSRNAKLIVLIIVAIFGVVLIVITISHHNVPKKVEPAIKFSFEPRLDSKSDLIWVKPRNESEKSTLGNKLKKILEAYAQNDEKNPPAYCQHGGFSATKNQSCKIDSFNLHESCTASNNNFGYDDPPSIPCVMIQMKTAKGWVPESFLNSSDLKLALGEGMPLPLHNQIETILNVSSNDPRLNTTWILCDGVSAADKENIGPVEYYSPAFTNGMFNGFPNFYFPFENQPNYKVPFIFLRFPKIEKGVLVNVNCRMYAKNLDQNHNIQFALLVE